MRPRFSIARLLSVVAICGVAFASLRSPSRLWAATLLAVALGSLPVALINTLYGRGLRRAFWMGFLICGATYFAATLGPWLRDEFGPRMATTALLDILYAQATPPPPVPGGVVTGTWVTGGSQPIVGNALVEGTASTGFTSVVTILGTSPQPPPSTSRWAAWAEPDRTDGVGYQVGRLTLVSTEPFRQIGHSLLTLLFAALGGIYARHRFAAEAGGPQ